MNNNLLNVSGQNFTYLSYFKFYNFNNKDKSNNKDTTTYIPDKNMPIFPPLKISFKPLKSKK
jgi:hypothetical protein